MLCNIDCFYHKEVVYYYPNQLLQAFYVQERHYQSIDNRNRQAPCEQVYPALLRYYLHFPLLTAFHYIGT